MSGLSLQRFRSPGKSSFCDNQPGARCQRLRIRKVCHSRDLRPMVGGTVTLTDDSPGPSGRVANSGGRPGLTAVCRTTPAARHVLAARAAKRGLSAEIQTGEEVAAAFRRGPDARAGERPRPVMPRPTERGTKSPGPTKKGRQIRAFRKSASNADFGGYPAWRADRAASGQLGGYLSTQLKLPTF